MLSIQQLKTNLNGFKVSAPTKAIAGAVTVISFLSGLVQAANASYTPVYTPIPFATPTANVPDILAFLMDVLQGCLNVVAANWMTFVMFMLCIVLIIWGAIVGLFRRGRRRGR